VRIDALTGARRIVGLLDFVAGMAQVDSDQFTNRRFVFDDEDFCRHGLDRKARETQRL
jgi:hypothetical protein